MTITAPSGRSYEWNKDTPPTADDYAALQKHEEELGGAKAVESPASLTPPAAKAIPDATPAPVEHPEYSDTRSWHIPNDYAAPTSRADKSASSASMAATSRYLAPLLQPEGGPGGAAAAGAGEKIAQLIEGRNDPGALATTTAAGAVPLGNVPGLKGVAMDGLKLAGASEIGQQIKSLIDSGELKNVADTAGSDGIAAVIPGVGKLLGAIIGKATGNVAPEEIARVKALMVDAGPKQAALEAGQRQGMKVIPSMVNRGNMVTDALESIGGMGATKRAFVDANDQAAMQAAKAHAGVPAEQPLSIDTLQAAEAPHAAVYEQLKADGDNGRTTVAQIKNEIGLSSDPHQQAVNAGDRATDMQAAKLQAGVDIDAWKAARKEAGRLQSAPYHAQDPQAIQAAQNKVDDLEQKIKEYAVAAGEPGMLAELQAARTGFAKINDVDRVMNQPGGSVNTKKIAAAYQRDPGKMTGELADVGQFANTFKDVTGTGAVRQDPGNSGTNAAGVVSLLMAKKPIAAAISLASPRERARQILMSNVLQNRLKVSTKAATSADPAVVLAVQRMMAQRNAQGATDE